MSRLERRGYRLLLRLLPEPLRADFGPDMEQLYVDRMQEEAGWFGRVGLRIEAIRDVVTTALRERGESVVRAVESVDWRGMMRNGWTHDIQYALRALRKRPGFTFAAVGTLSLGIAATVSMFGVVHAVLLAPLPFPASDQLVVLQNRDAQNGELLGETVAHPDVRTIQEEVPGLAMAGYSGTNPTLTGFGEPQIVAGARVTDGFITLTGLQPVIGRDIVAADDDPGADRVAVVSHDFWTRHFAGEADALGQSITLGGTPWLIVGVAPEGFDYPGGVDLWVPRRHNTDGCGFGCRIIRGVGRVDGDVETVRTALARTSDRLEETYPETHSGMEFGIEPLIDEQVSDVRTGILALFGSVIMVLLIACANVANLLLVRAQSRRREVALRRTLGASRARIVRELITESGVIAALAGIVGTGLAWWGTATLVRLAPASVPRLEGVRMDGTAVLFAFGLVVLVTAVFGVLPALKASRDVDVSRAGQRTAGSRGSERSRSVLLSLEFALSLSLLLGTGLLMRTLSEIRSVDLGFETENIERFRFSLPGANYDSLDVQPFIGALESELAAIPGVRAVGWGFGVPFARGNIHAGVEFLDRPAVDPQDEPELAVRPSTPGFLEANGMEMVAGRWFEDGDRYGGAPVIVINEATKREFYPDVDPIGRQMRVHVTWAFEDSPERTIVGVVEDVLRGSLTEQPDAAVYIPNAQFGAMSGYMTVALEPGVATAIPEARRIVTNLDPGLAIWGEETLAEAVAGARGDTTFYTTLLTVFSVIALLLAAVGLYGVVAYSVSQRTREIGVRIALGAAADHVVGMIVRQGLRPVLAGTVLGLIISAYGARLISSMLFGVSPQDPITIVGVTALLVLVTLAATAIPARRAARVPPATALEAE